VDCYNISLNSFLVYFIGKNAIIFLTKHYQLLQHLFSWVFFLPKLSLLVFFNIKLVENLALYFFCFLLTEKLNHVAKALYLSSQNIVDCYKSFCSISKFLITNTTFFSVMKYLLHHTFNFYYLSSAGSQL
jgi:hypothetical protein